MSPASYNALALSKVPCSLVKIWSRTHQHAALHPCRSRMCRTGSCLLNNTFSWARLVCMLSIYCIFTALPRKNNLQPFGISGRPNFGVSIASESHARLSGASLGDTGKSRTSGSHGPCQEDQACAAAVQTHEPLKREGGVT